MKEFKISVAMATYNGEKYVIKQLESIYNQSILPDEIIIVDDCSTDNTIALIKEYIMTHQEINCKLYINSVNVGYKKNFYRALQSTSGDIIFLADQDDEWKENKIQCIIKVFQDNESVLSVNSSIEYIDEKSEKKEIKLQKNYYNGNFLYSKESIKRLNYYNKLYISKHNISPGCTMAFRKIVLEEFLQIYNYSLPHDWFINLLASYQNGCVYLDEKLTRYRIHSSNTIGANTSIKTGIESKSNDIRIEDYTSRLAAINILENYFSDNLEMKNVELLYRRMISFYMKPKLDKLICLYRTEGYLELAKKKVRIWEIVLALHLDNLIKFFLNI